MLIEQTQTGAVAESSGLEIVSLSVTDPEPAVVDPTGGVRATNLTGKYNPQVKHILLSILQSVIGCRYKIILQCLLLIVFHPIKISEFFPFLF